MTFLPSRYLRREPGLASRFVLRRPAYDSGIVQILRLAAVLAFALASLPLHATTIIMVFMPGRVYIAADSKLSSVNGESNGIVCKLHVADNYVWASSGLLHESQRPFDLEQLVPASMGSGSPFPESIDNLEAQLRAVYPQLVDDVSATGASAEKAQIGIALANLQKAGEVSEIYIARSGLQRRDCPSQSCHETNGVFTFGEHKAVDAAMAANRGIWKQMGFVPALNYLIQQQAQATPQFVDDNVAIVEITSAGAQWLQGGACR